MDIFRKLYLFLNKNNVKICFLDLYSVKNLVNMTLYIYIYISLNITHMKISNNLAKVDAEVCQKDSNFQRVDFYSSFSFFPSSLPHS